jgi:murein L,D-transpeptidase YafK
MSTKKYLFLIVILLFAQSLSGQDFKEEQLQNGRVENAYENKESVITGLLQANDLSIESLEIYIRAFKKEKKLELWGRDSLHQKFIFLKEYRICRTSGQQGPKRKQGDSQIPEGFYHIDRFNPWSSFHLSLGINYPNASDKILSDKSRPGGDIFIHGSCVTIGCLPLTDEKIEEIYVFAVEAKNSGQQNIPVHIFPTKMQGEKYDALQEEYVDDESMIAFWKNLEEGYLYFETHKIIPDISVDKNGIYSFR